MHNYSILGRFDEYAEPYQRHAMIKNRLENGMD